jgi:hypothetical protein
MSAQLSRPPWRAHDRGAIRARSSYFSADYLGHQGGSRSQSAVTAPRIGGEGAGGRRDDDRSHMVRMETDLGTAGIPEHDSSVTGVTDDAAEDSVGAPNQPSDFELSHQRSWGVLGLHSHTFHAQPEDSNVVGGGEGALRYSATDALAQHFDKTRGRETMNSTPPPGDFAAAVPPLHTEF